MKMIDDLMTSFFAKLSPVPTAGKTGYLDEIPRVFDDGRMLTEAEYNQKIKEEGEKKKIKNLAVVKQRFANHEEIMTVVDKLPDEEKYYVLEFLVSLRKKQRDEFDWKRFKNALIEIEERNLKKNQRE